VKTAITWFRRDLRIADNPALAHACEVADHVVPVFIFAPDEEKPWQPGAASRWWLHHSLEALAGSLRKLGSPLVLRQATGTLRELKKLIAETGAEGVFWNRLYDPAIVQRDEAIKKALREDGVEAESFNAALLLEPWEIKTGSGGPYRVFTPFWNAMKARVPARALIAPPRKIPGPAKKVESLALEALGLLPSIPWDAGLRKSWTPGEQGAHDALDRLFGKRIAAYREARNIPGVDGTSRLSPYLHFGEIGPTQILARAQRHAAHHDGVGVFAGIETYAKEIGWREFSHHLLFHFPHTTLEPLDERFARLKWRRAPKDLQRWQRGETGIGIVDAGMRELWHTGWMHNRVRMIVASFLTKNLLISWQEGARWFWDTLVDADLANNTLGWQWTAGCGADAAPFFRVFNPVLQAQRFDQDGAYVRRWVPEAMRRDPAPIVDLKESRDRALGAFAQIKS
jgi:deoxyribodipyrimidine photo-lyase